MIYIKKDGEQKGPYSEGKIKWKLKNGELSNGDLFWREGQKGWKEIRELGFDISPYSKKIPAAKPSAKCALCGGQMIRRKVQRMSGPVTVIGWILLVPSFIGMLIFISMLFVTKSAVTKQTDQSQSREANGEGGNQHCRCRKGADRKGYAC